MGKQNYILVTEYCRQTNIDDIFLRNLEEFGLIEVKRESSEMFIYEDEISEIERMFRLHKELNINLEGIDALNHVLRKMQFLEDEVSQLRSKLRLYE